MKIRILLVVFPVLVLSGCWDKRELNEIAITLAMGIDKKDDLYLVSAQVVVPSEVSTQLSSGRTTVILIQGEGTTVFEAIRKMTKESPRKIYPGHLRMLIFSEELAREGIGQSLDLLSRDWELRSDFYVAVAKDQTAAEILNTTTTMEKIPANDMYNTLKTSEKSWAATKGITVDALINDLVSIGKSPVLTGIFIEGDPNAGTNKQNVEKIKPDTKIQFDHLAVFKKDKLIGWLNEEESRGFNNITNSIETTVASISCPEEGYASIETINLKTTMKGSVQDGEPKVAIHVSSNGNIGAVECPIDLTDEKAIAALEKSYKEQVERVIHDTIETVQQNFKTDIFGFGEAIRRSNPKEWKKIEPEWNEKFLNLPVTVNVKVKLHDTGTLNNTYLEKLKD